MAIDSRAGNKVIKNARREDAAGTRVDPYPYIGIIKNNLDPTRSGRLQVYIPDLGGPEDDPKNWRTVSYTSPFLGYTSQTQSSTDRPSQENKFGTVHHTYGMWMVPPDIGVQIIVIFVAGDPLRGYGLACVNPHLSHYMMPGLAGTSNVDRNSLTPGQRKQIQEGDIVPVVEFNEYTSDFTNNAFYNNNKPLHTYQYSIYQKQGLEKDIVRGPVSSSSQRESPSFVFGISTPGRPVNDPADDPSYLPDLEVGKLNSKYTEVKSRKGGHVFLMDDGATTGEDQLIRLRTAGGHQILMHDSNESLYIAHANGYSWVELTKDGKILAYSKRGMALRTEGTFDIHADGDFNLDVGGKINIKAGTSLKLETPLIDFLAEGKFNVTANAGTEFKVGAFKVDSAAKIGLKAGGIIALEGASIKQNSGGTDSLKAITPIQTRKLPEVTGSAGAWTSKPGALESIVTLAPTHEPYDRGTRARAFTPTSPGIQPNASFSGTDATKSDTTLTAGVENAATPKDIRNQPPAVAPAGSLTKDETTALMSQLGQGNDYTTTGSDGKLGKYQLDYKALQEQGYIKSTVTSNEQLTNPNSWTNKNSITDATSFLSNKTEQESVMSAVTNQNYTNLLASGAITADQTPADVAGMMSVAHKLGSDAALSFRSGSGPGAELFNQGKYAVSVLAPKLPSINAG
jgi:hypothetical protein